MNMILYKKICEIFENSNEALIQKGLNAANSFKGITEEISKVGSINRLPYLIGQNIIALIEDDLRGLTSIPDRAFRQSANLTSVTIPNSVTTIGDYAFDECANLTSVTLGDSVITIGDWAFYYCTSLTSITIPDSVTTIGAYALNSCHSLTSVTIGDSVTTIGDNAFTACKSLAAITIGKGVTSMGLNTFYNCPNLSHLYMRSITPPPILLATANAFENITIHIPIGSGDAYKSATNWSWLASQFVEDVIIE